DSAEAVRAAAFEIVGIARTQDTALGADGHLQASADDDAALLALMHQRHAPRICTGLVALFQNLQRAPDQVLADLPIGDAALSDLAQLLGHVENLARLFGLEREELGEADRNPVQNALQRADGRIDPVRFDQRNRGIRHTRPLGKLSLREVMTRTQIAQPPTDIDRRHPSLHVSDVEYIENLAGWTSTNQGSTKDEKRA